MRVFEDWLYNRIFFNTFLYQKKKKSVLQNQSFFFSVRSFFYGTPIHQLWDGGGGKHIQFSSELND